MINIKIAELIDARIIEEAKYIIETHCTIRDVAKKFDVSKSTVHRDLTVKLIHLNKSLYDEVRDILDYHLAIRAHRGGMALKLKYDNMQEINGAFFSTKNKSIPHKNTINNIILVCTYIKNTYASVEETAKHFCISKSTVYRRIKMYYKLEPKDGELVKCIIRMRACCNSKEEVAIRLAALNHGEI